MKHLYPFLATLILLNGCVSAKGVKSPSGQRAQPADNSAAVEKPAPNPPPVTGAVELVWEGVFGAGAGIKSPWGISFGVDGTLYVCDRDRFSILRLDNEGGLLARYRGSGTRAERLYSPIDICSSAGIPIYVIDQANSRILRFDRNLKNAFTIYNRTEDGARLFGSLNGLAFDRESGDLYVSDRESGALVRIDMLGHTVKSRGAFGSGKNTFDKPSGLDVGDDGRIFIADTGSGTIASLEHFGAQLVRIGKGTLTSPADIAVVPGLGIAVADRDGVVVMDTDGRGLGYAGFAMDRVMKPRSIAYRDSVLYISDAASDAILVYRMIIK